MNTKRIDKLLAETTITLDDLSFTDTEAEYFYKYVDFLHIFTLKYRSYNVYDMEIIHKLIKYDNVYLKYNTNAQYTVLRNMKFNDECFEMLFDRYVTTLKSKNTMTISLSFACTFHYNIKFFIKKVGYA